MFDWFYSDPHFGHRRIPELAGRPFSSIEEHDRELIRRYQAQVASDDTVLWLGDCFFCSPDEGADILRQLPGRKVLLLGNHDRSAARMAKLRFDLVTEGPVHLHLEGLEDTVVRACHYPYGDYRLDDGPRDADIRPFSGRRPERRKGEVLVHGHTHSRYVVQGNMIHVGVDAWGYAPAPASHVATLAWSMWNR